MVSMEKKILNNLGLKIISLIIAVVITVLYNMNNAGIAFNSLKQTIKQDRHFHCHEKNTIILLVSQVFLFC